MTTRPLNAPIKFLVSKPQSENLNLYLGYNWFNAY